MNLITGIACLIGVGVVLIVTFVAIQLIFLFVIDPGQTVELIKELFEEWIDNWKRFLHKGNSK